MSEDAAPAPGSDGGAPAATTAANPFLAASQPQSSGDAQMINPFLVTTAVHVNPFAASGGAAVGESAAAAPANAFWQAAAALSSGDVGVSSAGVSEVGPPGAEGPASSVGNSDMKVVANPFSGSVAPHSPFASAPRAADAPAVGVGGLAGLEAPAAAAAGANTNPFGDANPFGGAAASHNPFASAASAAGQASGAGSGAGAGAGAGAGSGGAAAEALDAAKVLLASDIKMGAAADWSKLGGRGLVGDASRDPRCRPAKSGLLRASVMMLAQVAACLPDADLASLQATCVKLRCAALKIANSRRRVRGMDVHFANTLATMSRFPVAVGDTLPLSAKFQQMGAVVKGCIVKPPTFTITAIDYDGDPESATLTVRAECPDESQLNVDEEADGFAVWPVSNGYYSLFDEDVSAPARRVGRTAEGWTTLEIDLPVNAPVDNEPRPVQVTLVGDLTPDPRPAQAKKLLEDAFAKVVATGVSWADGAVPDALATSINDNIDALAAAGEPDYHPGSKGVVRDLVHPALYPFVRGVSKFIPSPEMPTPTDFAATARRDMWGRPYTASVYQWLPAPFHISESGRCSIKEYINNLPRDGNEGLYADLESLFEVMLPHLETVVGYANAHAAAMAGADEVDYEVDWMSSEEEGEDVAPPVSDADVTPVSLRGREVQVITKIVEYELHQGYKHESVWHVEGMSHENIIATGVYVAARSGSVQGGALKFQRPFTPSEGQRVYDSLNRNALMLEEAQKMLEDDCVPLGHLPTPAGRVFVFPNSHVHMVTPLQALGAGGGRRRIVVFWLVNPATRIVSTREVAPQQGVMSVEEARDHRLKLMMERKFHKETRNVRPVSLCEH